jgi:hypothetical protein
VELGPVLLLSGGAVQVGVTGLAGQTYLIQASTDLVNWTTLTTLTLTNGTGQFIDSSPANVNQRFYRAVVFSAAQPQLGSVSLLSGGVVQLGVKGLSGQTYIIEASTNLVIWAPIYTNGGSFMFTDPNAPNYNRRFYRAAMQ